MTRRTPSLLTLLTILGTLLALLAIGSGSAHAATPANTNDPCAQSGRDTCGTTGVGSYHSYAYGLRWFGDYRGAVPGVTGPTFCIDLNFWFPGKSYKYAQRSTDGLTNKSGATVSAATLARISYAIWNAGRSSDANQQSAVMLYVHSQIADAPAAQTAANSIGSAVAAIDNRVAAQASRYAGPYKVSVSLPTKTTAAKTVTATLKVISASGHAVPGVSFDLDASGASNAPSSATANANGIATVKLTPSDSVQGLSLKATATGLAADAPTLYVPTAGAAASNGQRLIAPASESLSASASAAVSLITPTIASSATPASLTVGSPDADTVTFSGLPTGYGQNATVNVYGPAASQSTIDCSAAPVASVSLMAANGKSTAPSFTPTQAGWYGYEISLPGTSTVAATTSPCAPSSESFQAVLATPTVTSQATPATLSLGATNADSVTIAGMPSTTTPTATINLYGPAASASTIDCSGTPVSSATFAAANGTVSAPAVTPAQVGWYGYQISIPATNATTGVTTACAPATESFQVTTTPAVHTQVSNATITPGTSLSDTVDVSGLAGQSATVTANLYGPFASTQAISCTGTPAWTGTVPVTEDGTYQTAATKLSTPGYYVYNESIAAGGFVTAASTTCADSAETTLVTGAPTITTKVSDTTIAPGDSLQDHAVISGLGKLPAKVHVVLWGPYKSAAAVDCSGTPTWSGSFNANGNGTYLTKKVTIPAGGYYVYQESIAASAAYPAVTTDCADSAETSLVKPAPTLSTTPSASVVMPGGTVTDAIAVSGIGSQPAKIDVDLYGPFTSLSQLSCSGSPAWSGSVTARGDGTVTSGEAPIKSVGFYVFRETLEGTGLVPTVTTPCADVAETVLGRPQIITGPGVANFTDLSAPLVSSSATSHVAASAAASAPTQVSIGSLGIDAPISRDAIDLKAGQMEIPTNIHHVGWWQDGAAPGDSSGTTLLFGHIDHVNEGPGAFYDLAMAGDGKESITGDQVTVKTADGKSYTYRITSVQRMAKAQLPTSIFNRGGARKLVMVTCGGAFDPKTHHYVDNVVVTAVPV